MPYCDLCWKNMQLQYMKSLLWSECCAYDSSERRERQTDITRSLNERVHFFLPVGGHEFYWVMERRWEYTVLEQFISRMFRKVFNNVPDGKKKKGEKKNLPSKKKKFLFKEISIFNSLHILRFKTCALLKARQLCVVLNLDYSSSRHWTVLTSTRINTS